MKNKIIIFAITLMASIISLQHVTAVSTYRLLGAASYVMPGHESNLAVKLITNTYNGDSGDDFSAVDFYIPSTLTLADIHYLGFDYNFINGTCYRESPRFKISVDTPDGTGYVFVSRLNGAHYTNCPMDSWNTFANLGDQVDATLPGFGDNTSFDQINAIYGDMRVTGIQLIANMGWPAIEGQAVLVDNVRINDNLYTFETSNKDACKKGGYKNFMFSSGPFRNQGECVSYFEKNKY